jgi:hypothetical protein
MPNEVARSGGEDCFPGSRAVNSPKRAGPKVVDREEVVMKLVAGAALTSEERAALGAFVTREEVGAAIALLLQRYGCFPFDGECPSGLTLVVNHSGVQVTLRRRSTADSGHTTTVETAIGRYIDEEFGPSCQGIQIRLTAAPTERPQGS